MPFTIPDTTGLRLSRLRLRLRAFSATAYGAAISYRNIGIGPPYNRALL